MRHVLRCAVFVVWAGFGEIGIFRLPLRWQQIAVLKAVGAGKVSIAKLCADLVQVQIALGKLG